MGWSLFSGSRKPGVRNKVESGGCVDCALLMFIDSLTLLFSSRYPLTIMHTNQQAHSSRPARQEAFRQRSFQPNHQYLTRRLQTRRHQQY
jgi:hypothetical protein